jgi:hypothetical protein
MEEIFTGDKEVDSVIREFAPSMEAYRGEDMCGWSASQFARSLLSAGIESEIINCAAPGEGVEHEVCEVRGFLVDFSAEQFHSEFGFPFIARDLEDYAEFDLYLKEQKRVPYFLPRVVRG